MLNEGNGHNNPEDIGEIAVSDAERESFTGARAKLKELANDDGEIAKLTDRIGKTNLGVLMRAMSAYGDEEYRNILKSGSYGPPRSRQAREKARQAVKAIDECRRFGNLKGIKSILDDITAQSAVEPSGLLESVFETLTHTTFTTNSSASRKNWNDNKNGSALS